MRASIIQAATELFTEQGYESTTIDDIVDRANYSRSTFFRHFGAKEDVLFGDLPEHLVAMIEGLRELEDTGDFIGSVRETYRHALEAVLVTPELATEVVALWFSVPALQRRYAESVLQAERLLTDIFAERMGQDPDTCIEAQVIAVAIIGVARAALMARLSESHSVVEVLDRGFDLIESGTRGSSLLTSTEHKHRQQNRAD